MIIRYRRFGGTYRFIFLSVISVHYFVLYVQHVLEELISFLV